ncbi:Minor fimbrium subunit Mfa1 [Porphyromonas levii]|uniref:Mfa1 family fimbria major subunit n=1 Tax=Porphyromonas levii TaxID=28114 RepID=UPI001BA50708|nr:Mfa1 family fimbria major subunit [Porphyromonas levii]MBR8773213.1 Minor fimbrium subunit Mfa1 [Porphyromonas levii]
MKKFFSVGALALALIMGMSSCSKEKGNTPDTPESNLDTYVGVRIAFSGAGTRTHPDDHNKQPYTWEGRDEIKKITVYLVNTAKGKVDFTTFNKESFEGINDGFLKPTLAVKATKGENVKAYAVINDINDLTKSLQDAAAGEFDAKFKELMVTVKNSSEVGTYSAGSGSGSGSDIVMMTNDSEAAEIAEVVQATKEDAIEGRKNRADIKVSRVVSRAIVTVKKDLTKTIEVKNSNGAKVSEITIGDITYAVGQSNLKFFNMHKTDWMTPEPVYSYVPENDWTTKGKTYFDYSDLNSPKAPLGIINEEVGLKEALGKEEFSKFVLPVTHDTGKYKKGNMTYFEVSCKFEANKVIDASGERKGVLGEDVYLGMSDGKFYATRELAGKGQEVTKYKSGVMKYVIWLNPNGGYAEKVKITESPTVRNQVYHAHISGFKEIGVPNNPLNPDDPNDPENPENPINPNDDPETEKTYLSVSIRVLPWTIHSYSVDLGNRY